MLFLLTGFGRRSLALFNQTIDVTLEILPGGGLEPPTFGL